MNQFFALVATLSMMILASCSSFGPKPEVVYHRPELKIPAESKLIVFPVMTFKGKTNVDKGLAGSVTSGWSDFHGSAKTIPAGDAIVQVAKKSGFDLMNLVKAMDNVSYLEQNLKKNRKFKKFINQVTSKFGNYDFAMTLVHGSEKLYESGSPVRLHLGYFNTKTMTWKWITKIQDKKGTIGNWQAAYGTLVSNSFDSLPEVHTASRNLASE